MFNRLIVLLRHQPRYVGRHRAAEPVAPSPALSEFME
jgi:hypothetical protein